MKRCERCGKSFNCTSDESCGCFSVPKLPSLPSQYKDCLCNECLKDFRNALPDLPTAGDLHEGEDFYYDHGLFVFTASYHLKKGYCCANGCRHCPYKDSN